MVIGGHSASILVERIRHGDTWAFDLAALFRLRHSIQTSFGDVTNFEKWGRSLLAVGELAGAFPSGPAMETTLSHGLQIADRKGAQTEKVPGTY